MNVFRNFFSVVPYKTYFSFYIIDLTSQLDGKISRSEFVPPPYASCLSWLYPLAKCTAYAFSQII